MVTTVRALSGDAELLDRLARAPFTATVHSVFDRLVNLISGDDGQLCTVATAAEVDDAPATLLVDVPRSGFRELRIGDVVTARRERLLLPGRIVDMRGARPWAPSLPALPMPATSLDWLTDFLSAEGISGGAMVGPGATRWEVTVAARVEHRLLLLLNGIRTRDKQLVTEYATRLVGLGPGLTPTGDDVLLGLLLAVAMPKSTLADHLPALRRVVDRAQTNDISRAALRQAARGRTRRRLVDLLDAMARGDSRPALNRLGRRVTAIGHTSGTDILVGLSAALSLESELRGEQ